MVLGYFPCPLQPVSPHKTHIPSKSPPYTSGILFWKSEQKEDTSLCKSNFKT